MKLENLLTKKEMKGVAGGEELRKQRNNLCYSQEYMANQLGITQSTYQRLESGEIKISLERLIQIAEIFKTPIEKSTANEKSTNDQITQLQIIVLEQKQKIDALQYELNVLKSLHHPNITAKMT